MRFRILLLFFHFTFQALYSQDLGADRYFRQETRDGYVIGNGRLYAIGALGRELYRSGKTQLTDRAVSRTQLGWVTGPFYAAGNLGYGWELKAVVEGDSITWREESILRPTAQRPFWGVRCQAEGLEAELTDVVVPDEAVLLRNIVVRRLPGAKPSPVRLYFPVHADPRNGVYAMFSGKEVDAEQIRRWGAYCGPNLKPRASVAPQRMRQLFAGQGALVMVGAARALWQEISTIVPADSVYARMFPPRALATAVHCAHPASKSGADSNGLWVDLGEMGAGESRTVTVWLTAVTGTDVELEQAALSSLDQWRKRNPAEVVEQSRRRLPEPPLVRTDDQEAPLLNSVNVIAGLARAAQARAGGVMAQPYMYPMYYVRDQYGSFRLFVALGDRERALRVLRFYVGMQGRDGIQNAHDAFPEPPDPEAWLPDANGKDGFHRRAEVPSYIILMARDYCRATGDWQSLRPMYDRLAYNLRVQAFSPNGVLPWATDESYTNTRQTNPRFGDEMADSQWLYLGAASFMAELAEKLGRRADAGEFRDRYRQAYEALIDRFLLPGMPYPAFARDSTDRTDRIDRRPAFDALLRWFWLELGSPQDKMAGDQLQTVLDSLIDPVRVVPEFAWCAGMDPGYLLYALSRRQHPAAHEAARLLMRYASADGLFSEYYEYQDSLIRPTGGTMRPWESSINATCIIQYLLGLRLDLPAGKIYLQPHLPPGWPGWRSHEIDLGREGKLRVALERQGEQITCKVTRSGGREPLTVEVEFGLFGDKLRPGKKGGRLLHPQGRPDLLSGQFIFAAASSSGNTKKIIFEPLTTSARHSPERAKAGNH